MTESKKPKSVLGLKRYEVLEFHYKHINLTEKEEFKLKFDLDHNISEKDGLIFVNLFADVINHNSIPDKEEYFVKANIQGTFELIKDEDTELTKEQENHLKEVSTITILFPFLRSLINSINTLGEKSLIFPVINIRNYIKNNWKL